MADHIPDPGRHRTHFYDYYANRVRGDRAALEPGEPTLEEQPAQKRRCSASWARLISKVFHVDPLTCAKCGGKLEIIAYLHDQVSISKILHHLGLSPPEPACLAGLAFNRLYSTQFHLWFYPFLIALVLVDEDRRRARMLAMAAAALDVLNIVVYPFALSYAYTEMHGFAVHGAALRGGTWTVVFTVTVILRVLAVCLLAVLVWRSARSRRPSSPRPPAGGREHGPPKAKERLEEGAPIGVYSPSSPPAVARFGQEVT